MKYMFQHIIRILFSWRIRKWWFPIDNATHRRFQPFVNCFLNDSSNSLHHYRGTPWPCTQLSLVSLFTLEKKLWPLEHHIHQVGRQQHLLKALSTLNSHISGTIWPNSMKLCMIIQLNILHTLAKFQLARPTASSTRLSTASFEVTVYFKQP